MHVKQRNKVEKYELHTAHQNTAQQTRKWPAINIDNITSSTDTHTHTLAVLERLSS